MSNGFDAPDDFDDIELGNALRRMAGSVPDSSAAFGTFQRRVRVARIRRISVAVSSGAAVVALGAGAFALSGRSPSPISPADPGITLESVVDPSTPDGTPGTSSDNSGTSGTGKPGTGTPSGGSGTPSGSSGLSGGTGGGSGSGKPTGSTTSTTSPDDDGPGTTSSTSSTTSTTSTTVASVNKRCTSAYGSFTAVHSGGVLSLKDIVPAAGYTVHETETEDSSVKVVFRSGETEVSLEANWNGSLFTCTVES